MKAYIATGLKNVAFYSLVRHILAALDIGITFDWSIAPALDYKTPGPEHTERALVDLNGVRAADFVVVLLPGGHGAHVELGYALALGKPILMLGKHDAPYISVFHHHPLVTRDPAGNEDIEYALNNFIRKWFGIR